MHPRKLLPALLLTSHAMFATAQPQQSTPSVQPSIKAQAPGSAEIHLFVQLDRNKDGFVTRDEAERSATALSEFNAIDRDKDGKLSRPEWMQFFGGREFK